MLVLCYVSSTLVAETRYHHFVWQCYYHLKVGWKGLSGFKIYGMERHQFFKPYNSPFRRYHVQAYGLTTWESSRTPKCHEGNVNGGCYIDSHAFWPHGNIFEFELVILWVRIVYSLQTRYWFLYIWNWYIFMPFRLNSIPKRFGPRRHANANMKYDKRI